jgi:predicted DsbA family dithiol-disulfide isomerase
LLLSTNLVGTVSFRKALAKGQAMAETTPLPIDMVSDVVCPWCYVGKRLLERAIELKPEIPVEVRFRPYFLNPWIPREGMSREDYLTAKWGSVENYNNGASRIAEAAASVGLTYARDSIKRQPNTLDCHRLILWAGYVGNAAPMKQRLMDLYFAEGGDLTDRAVLVQAAVDCGLDPEPVNKLLDSDEDVERIQGEANAAKDAGIDGVPCFIFGGLIAVSGAQSPLYLAQTIERAADEIARRVAAE